jgi:hypothetical protein
MLGAFIPSVLMFLNQCSEYGIGNMLGVSLSAIMVGAFGSLSNVTGSSDSRKADFLLWTYSSKYVRVDLWSKG